MYIHEYQAKDILRNYGIRTSPGFLISNLNDLEKELDKYNWKKYVVKAQVYSGGRGKAGGIIICKTKEGVRQACFKLLDTTLVTNQNGPNGQKINHLYIESFSEIEREMYLSMNLDRSLDSIVILSGSMGGIDVEGQKIDSIKINWFAGLQDYHVFHVIKSLKLETKNFFFIQGILSGLWNAIKSFDITQIEINPLILNDQHEFIVLDTKITFDDNGLFRQPKIVNLKDVTQYEATELAAAKSNLSYVRMNGNIGCIVNGAGLALATMDIIKNYGGQPANFLDVGGNVTEDAFVKAIEIIVSDKNVEKILINIFGGIVKCDLIAEGIISAINKLQISMPIVVRLQGTNASIALEMLEKSNLNLIFAKTLNQAAELIIKS